MTTSEYADALLWPLLRQYWWVIVLFVAASISKLFMPAIKGRIGEGVVNLAAKLRLDPKTYHLIKDVTIPSKKGTTQIDHLIVSIYGLFVIETKNYKGWIFGDAKSRNWTQVNFKKKNRFQNPLHQNNAHISALSDLLGISRNKIHGLVCFMGDAKFKTKIPDGVFIQGSYVTHIKSFKSPVFLEAEVAEIINQIEASRLKRGFKTNRAHVQQLKTRHTTGAGGFRSVETGGDGAPPSKEIDDHHQSTEKSCPKCGEEMVLRTARRGANAGNQFWGCSSYPKCRSTHPITD